MNQNIALCFLAFLFYSCSEQKRQNTLNENTHFVLSIADSQIRSTREIVAGKSRKKILLLGDSVDLERGATESQMVDSLTLHAGLMKKDNLGLFYGKVITKLPALKSREQDTLFFKELENDGSTRKWLLHFSNPLLKDQMLSPTLHLLDGEFTLSDEIFVTDEPSHFNSTPHLFDIQKDSLSLGVNLVFEIIK